MPKPFATDLHASAITPEAVFHDTWQPIGLAHQVARPGSYFTADLLGEPIAVVRGDDGTLRAFANVCRHRGARVLHEPCGEVTRLRWMCCMACSRTGLTNP